MSDVTLTIDDQEARVPEPFNELDELPIHP